MPYRILLFVAEPSEQTPQSPRGPDNTQCRFPKLSDRGSGFRLASEGTGTPTYRSHAGGLPGFLFFASGTVKAVNLFFGAVAVCADFALPRGVPALQNGSEPR